MRGLNHSNEKNWMLSTQHERRNELEAITVQPQAFIQPRSNCRCQSSVPHFSGELEKQTAMSPPPVQGHPAVASTSNGMPALDM